MTVDWLTSKRSKQMLLIMGFNGLDEHLCSIIGLRVKIVGRCCKLFYKNSDSFKRLKAVGIL